MQKKKVSGFLKSKGIKQDVLAVSIVFLLAYIYILNLSFRNISSAISYSKSLSQRLTIQSSPTSSRQVVIEPIQTIEPQYTRQQNFPVDNIDNQQDNVEIPIQNFNPPVQVRTNPSGPQTNIVGGNNFTQNQITQLQQAAQNIMQNWQNLSTDQQTALQERSQELQQQIMNMNDQQRQAALVRIQQQVQQWMQSGQQGIPNISLE
jgi:hypothetical protein